MTPRNAIITLSVTLWLIISIGLQYEDVSIFVRIGVPVLLFMTMHATLNSAAKRFGWHAITAKTYLRLLELFAP